MAKTIIRSSLMAFQRRFRLWPTSFCLVTGAPRSGTSAVFEWLAQKPAVAAFSETRILVAAHRLTEQVLRFSCLAEHETALVAQARRLIYHHYGSQQILMGKRLIVDKEPLEPIAFPDRQYQAFLDSLRSVLPQARLLLMIREPVASVWSMSQRKWGFSLTHGEPRSFSLEQHLDTWCASAALVARHASDPNACICSFGRLVSDPATESKQICDFLKIRPGTPFQPRPTREVGFSDEERALIRQQTRPYLEALETQGITGLE